MLEQKKKIQWLDIEEIYDNLRETQSEFLVSLTSIPDNKKKKIVTPHYNNLKEEFDILSNISALKKFINITEVPPEKNNKITPFGFKELLNISEIVKEQCNYNPNAGNYSNYNPNSGNYNSYNPDTSDYSGYDGNRYENSGDYSRYNPNTSNYSGHNPNTSNYSGHNPYSGNYSSYNPNTSDYSIYYGLTHENHYHDNGDGTTTRGC